MKALPTVELRDVQAVYSGPEGDLWELIMGEQIHIGGFRSSMALAECAGIGAGMWGVDLCCCTGAGMRFFGPLPTGSHAMGRRRRHGDGHPAGHRAVPRAGHDRPGPVHAGRRLPDGPSQRVGADFVWGEDAWCYVVDKQALVAEAARPGQAGRR